MQNPSDMDGYRNNARIPDGSRGLDHDIGHPSSLFARPNHPSLRYLWHSRTLAAIVRRRKWPTAEDGGPQVEVRYCLVVHPEVLIPPEDAHGWTVLATTVGLVGCTDAAMLQAYQEQHSTVAPGLRWIKHPAAISPVWLGETRADGGVSHAHGVGLARGDAPITQHHTR
jgi:hypothetical protein